MTAPQLNIEYVFRIFYECLRGACHSSADLTYLSLWLTKLWLWIVIVGYVLSVIALVSIVYATIRLFELRRREEVYYSTLIPRPGTQGENHPRWDHIQSLVQGTNPSDWRTAILEADIMLDELLTQRGYNGVGLGEKLKMVDPKKFTTLSDAWEAHKVRNQIAHEGSTFEISQTLAERTVGRYEAVFREFKVI